MGLRKRVFIVMCLLCSIAKTEMKAQVDSTNIVHYMFSASAGLGVSWIAMPEIVDYIDALQVQSDLLKRWSTSPEFFGAIAVRIDTSWDIGVEYSYLLNSYSIAQSFGPNASFTSIIHMPTLLIHYLMLGERSALKLGGGVGYHVGSFSEDYYSGSGTWTAGGIGVKLEAIAHTSFDEHLYSYITADLRKDFMSDLHAADGTHLVNQTTGKNIDMSFFGAGIKFGLTYYF